MASLTGLGRASPCMVKLEDGLVYCVYYDVGEGVEHLGRAAVGGRQA
jgi:hypothetical protein